MSDDWLGSSPADPKKRVDWFVRNYWVAICRDAYEMAGNWQDAEDIAQDTFIRVMKFLEDEPDIEVMAPRPWLRSFLRFAFLDFLRRKKKSAKYSFSEISLERLEIMKPSEWQKLFEELVDDVDKSPDIMAESNQGVTAIGQEVVKLRKVSMREALYFYLFKGWTYEEIANEQNRRLGTVKWEISVGKELLRTALEKRMQDER